MARTVDYTDLEDLADNILICRAMWQHPWSKNPTPRPPRGPVALMASYIIAVRCTRCRRERYEYLDSKGVRLGKPYYRDPKGYPKMRRTDGDHLRAELIRRSLWVTAYDGQEGG